MNILLDTHVLIWLAMNLERYPIDRLESKHYCWEKSWVFWENPPSLLYR